MDIRFLESFLIVVESGSLAAASRRLGLTPAAVAQRLQKLEHDIGRPLVTRVGRTIQPTESGLAIVAHARTVVNSARDLRAIAANDQPEGRIRLGATATALTGLLPDIILHLSKCYPRIQYFVRPGSSLDLYQELISGELDAAVMVRPPIVLPKSTDWLQLREEPLVLIAPMSVAPVDPHEMIEHYPFIRYDRNQWGGQLVDRYLRQHNLKVQEWLELDALDAIAGFVGRGLGVSIVPDWPPPWPSGLNLGKFALNVGEVRQTGVLWNKSGAQIAATRAFVESCREAILRVE